MLYFEEICDLKNIKKIVSQNKKYYIYHGTSTWTFGLLKISAALCLLFVGIGSPCGV